MTERYYTTSTAFLEALSEAGISYIFANLGSDHPGIIESFAQAKADRREDELPKLIICPHETVALSAAHAYAMVTGEPQAVVVHVDSGTQNVGGMVNNAMRGRVPVLVFAGTVPYTQDGELPGSRTEFIQWIQDVRDQRGILRNYVKYDNELRTGRNVKQLVHRALQIARSEPAGPVYLTGAREVMEERIEPYQVDPGSYPPVAPAALTAEVTAEIATALAGARHPLIVTSYLGRDPAAVPSLVALSELLAVPVLEAMAYHVNFPADHPLHAGFQYHSTGQNPVLAEADAAVWYDVGMRQWRGAGQILVLHLVSGGTELIDDAGDMDGVPDQHGIGEKAEATGFVHHLLVVAGAKSQLAKNKDLARMWRNSPRLSCS